MDRALVGLLFVLVGSAAAPAAAQELRGPCVYQMQVGGEWTTPSACTFDRHGRVIRLDARAHDHGLRGTVRGDAAGWSFAGRYLCPSGRCPARIRLRMEPDGRDGFRGTFPHRGGQVIVSVRLLDRPVDPPVRAEPPPGPARPAAPAPFAAGRYQLRVHIDGEWTGMIEEALVVAGDNGALALRIAESPFVRLEGNIVADARGTRIVGTLIDPESGRSRPITLQLRPTPDAAWAGRTVMAGNPVDLELRPIASTDLARFEGLHTCRVRRGRGYGAPFSCNIVQGDAQVFMQPPEPDDATARDSIQGTLVPTPTGFRVWGSYQCDAGDENNICMVQGPIEFTANPAGGFTGRLVFRGRLLEISMT